MILGVIVAVFLVLPLALAGACFAFFGATSLTSREGLGFAAVMLGVGALAIGAAIGLGVLVKKLWK